MAKKTATTKTKTKHLEIIEIPMDIDLLQDDDPEEFISSDLNEFLNKIQFK